MNNQATSNQSGAILITTVIIIMVLATFGLSLLRFATKQLQVVNRDIARRNAFFAAETGIEYAIHKLNQDDTYGGTGAEVTLYDNQIQGKGTYKTDVTTGATNDERVVTSTGKVSLPQGETTRTIEARIAEVTVGNYSVHTGPGGLIMANNSTVTNGEVHVNGFIEMSNQAKIGTSSDPTEVNVAHINCPSGGGPGYPEQCTSGEPISIVNQAHIYGDVYATNQDDGSDMSNQGLVKDSSASKVELPPHDRQAQQDAVSNTRTGSSASCTNNETRTWAANTHITGDVNIRNNCEVLVEGDIWIDGSLETFNSSALKISDSLTERPVIMVDGQTVSFGNSSSIISNDDSIGAEVIAYYSTATCSPDCSDVTGQDLYDSQSIATIQLQNSGSMVGSVLYTRWTKLVVANNVDIGGIIGQTIELQNSANLYFDGAHVSGDSVWTLKNYQRIYQ